VVNVRTPPLERRGLKFEIQASFPRPFYFAGETQAFFLDVANPTDSGVTVTCQVAWEMRSAYGHFTDAEQFKMEIPPKNHLSYGLRPQWLYAPGEAVYILTLDAAPPSGARPAYPGETHPIASYIVYDRAVKEEQDKHREIAETLQRRTLYAFIASVIASAVLAATAIFLSVYH
jgi:hypothetical protein